MFSHSINSSQPTDTLLFLDQCTLNPDGSLKDASEITWHHDRDDEKPIASGSKATGPSHTAFTIHQFVISCTDCVWRSHDMDQMAEIINAEQDSDNQDDPKPSRKCKRKPKQKAVESDKNNGDFAGSSSDSDSVSEDDDMDCVEITNIKVCFYLTLCHILIVFEAC